MKYKNNNTFVPTAGASVRYLQSLGIKDVESFLYKPKPSDYESPWKLDNMRTLIDKLHDGFENKKHFFVQVDSDTDGFTSSSIFINYFKKLYPEADIQYRVHDGKEHGVIVDTIPVVTDIVIIPDAGSNQIDEFEELKNKGITVLVMDHHIINHPSNFDNVTIVNNQASENFYNKELSGAGVVYKAIQAYDEIYNHKAGDYKEFEDLAALGIIADMMDSRTLDNNAIIKNGLNNVSNPMLEAILAQQQFKIGANKAPNKIDIAFYVAPLINAVIRFGTPEEKTEFFEGFITKTDKVVHSFSRGKERDETIYQYLARTASNLRNRQNTAKEKSLATICEKIANKHIDDNCAIVVKVDASYLSQNITGLAAMEICKKYGNRPTLLLRPVIETKMDEYGHSYEEIYYRGSGRACVAEGFSSFMNVLKDSGLMDYVEGHDNAFGASILERNIPALNDYLNQHLAGIDFGDYNEVDCHMDDDNWDNICLQEFGKIIDVFGNGIPQPKFHFEFQVRDRDIRVQGKKEDSLKISHNGVCFVSFQNKKLVERYLEVADQAFQEGKEIKIECIGRSQINEWQGYQNINIMIDNIELSVCEPKRKALF